MSNSKLMFFIYNLVRFCLNMSRSIEPLVWAIIFSVWTVNLYYRSWSGPPFPKIVDIVHHSQFIEVFLIGVLAAWATHLLREKIVFKPKVWRILEGLVALALVCLLGYLCALTCEKFFWFELSDYSFRFQSWLFALVFAALIFVVEKFPRGYLSAFFNNRLLRAMGVFGFSWYLLHFPIFYYISTLREELDFSFTGENTFYFLLSWAACGLVSWMTFSLIERPGISLGRRLEGRSRSLR